MLTKYTMQKQPYSWGLGQCVILEGATSPAREAKHNCAARAVSII